MKKIITFLLFLCLCCSCKQKNIWQFERTIQYEKGFSYCEKDINKIIIFFEKQINHNKEEWHNYGQFCQYYKKLFVIHGFISEKDFFEKICSIYEKWFLYNPDDTEHLIPYSFLLIVNNNEKKGIELLNSMYDREFSYNFSTPSQEDIKMFFCSFVLGKINREEFEGTIYENCLDFDMKEIAVMFCGI